MMREKLISDFKAAGHAIELLGKPEAFKPTDVKLPMKKPKKEAPWLLEKDNRELMAAWTKALDEGNKPLADRIMDQILYFKTVGPTVNYYGSR